MRKLYPVLLLVFVSFFIFNDLFSQCTPDPQYTAAGIYPDTIPPGCVGQMYSEVFTAVVPLDTVVDVPPFGLINVPIDSFVLREINGLPPGIAVTCNTSNCSIPGGSSGCFVIGGIPNVADTFSIDVIVEAFVTLFFIPQSILDTTIGAFTFIVSDPPIVSTSFTNETITGAFDGTASASVSGGTLPYRYLWSTGDTTSSISGLTAGQYFVDVTGATGCLTRDTVNVGADLILSIGSICANAEIISAIPFNSSGKTTEGSADDYRDAITCNSDYISGEDYVFTYTPSAPECLEINLLGTEPHTGLFVFSECPDGTGPVCIASSISTTAVPPSITEANLSPGLKHYVIVSTNAAFVNNTVFAIEVDLSPVVCAVLPVALRDFKGEQFNDDIRLRWETLSEVNNDRFILEKKGANGVYVELVSLPSTSTTSSGSKYGFTDTKPVQGINEYRLSQLDLDGRRNLAGELSVTFDLNELSAKIYPNPGFGKLNLALRTKLTDQYHLKVTNELGQVIYEDQRFLEAGSHVWEVPADTWESGIYLVRFGCEDGRHAETLKFVNFR